MPHATSVYWVKAHLEFDNMGSLHGKVAFGQGREPACSLVPAETQGWYFSSKEHADELAEYAAGKLAAGLSGLAVPVSVITEVCEA